MQKGFYGVKDIKQGLLSKQDWVDLGDGRSSCTPCPRHTRISNDH